MEIRLNLVKNLEQIWTKLVRIWTEQMKFRNNLDRISELIRSYIEDLVIF